VTTWFNPRVQIVKKRRQLGFSGKMPLVHRYAVYYGMTTAVEPEEMWSFTGTDFYDGYTPTKSFVMVWKR